MKKRILFIMHLPPPVHGATMMCEAIKNSSRVTNAFDCCFVNCSGSKSMKDVNRTSFRKTLRLVAVFLQTARHLFFERFDLVYLTIAPCGPAFFKDSILILMAKIARKNVVIHMHGRGIKEACKKNRFLAWYYQKVFAGVNVIHLSGSLMPDIADFVHPKRRFVVGNGANVKSGVITRRVKEVKVPRILYLSNLIKSKGYLDLLTAADLLQGRGCDFSIDFVGARDRSAGEEEGDLRFVHKHGLVGKIHFLGGKYGSEKDALLRSADIFVLPTYYERECFPLCILEAMAYGIPVISTDVGAIAEIVEDGVTGCIVPVKNPEALADAIEGLLQDPELRNRLGQAGLKKYAKEYTLEAFEARLCGVLGQITETA